MKRLREHDLGVPFIGAWYIDPKICDQLIAYHNGAPKHEGVSSSGEVNKLVKDSIDCHVEGPVRETYLSAVWDCTKHYIDRYPYCAHGGPSWSIREKVNIQYYPPGAGFHALHCERRNTEPSIRRHLVFLTFLNDVYKGGETEFHHQGLKVPARKGLTLIWPTDWTFLHRGIPSFDEEKYVATGWYSYGD